MAKHRSSFVPFSLYTILTIPYVSLLVFIVAAIGYLSFLNSQAAVNDVALQLRNETTLRIQQHLATFLNIPHQINQLNAYVIQNGDLNPNNPNEIQRYFLEQVRIHPSITSVYFGNLEGGLVGAGREGTEGSLYVTSTENLTSGDFQKFSVNEKGAFKLLPPTVPNFDARLRPWYVNASQKGEATWSETYVLFTGQDMAIAASRPVYDENGNLLGVVSVDIFLSQLSSYLETQSISPTGQVFIMEHSGALVATSTGEPLFTDENNDGGMERVFASNSQSKAIRHSDNLLIQTYGNYTDIPAEAVNLEFILDGERQFVQSMSVHDPYGIDWIVVVVIPESAFMGRIQSGNFITMVLAVVALVFVAGSSVFITSRITRRVSQLDQSAQALTEGEWDLKLDTDTHIIELNHLAHSFNEMKEKLRLTMDDLTSEIAQHKQADEALEAEILRRRLFFEESPDGILIIDPETTRFKEFNTTAHQQLGYSREEFSELSIFELEAAKTEEQIRTLVAEILQSGKADFDTLLRTKQGGVRNVQVKVKIISIHDTPEYYCIWRDITEQKRLEQELQTQRDFATQIINLMGQGLAVTDEKGHFEFVNPAYARLFGYEVKDLIGKTPRDVTVSEEHEYIAKQRKLRRAGKTTTYESHLKRADGSIATVLITGVPRGHVGDYKGSITVITDLTGQKRIEEELRFARDAVELSKRKLEEALTRERHLARTDELTGINNRRQLFELAERKFAVARRYKQSLAVIMFDIDHFKNINDLYGHITGDQMLIEVAHATQSEMRNADLFGRYGGEEFIILSPMTNAQQAYALAERIRMRIADLRVQAEKEEVNVTVSIGIVELHHNDPAESLETLFRRADEAMYAAKQAGRNCTVVAVK